MFRRPSSTMFNIFSTETAGPIKAKFYVEPPWEGGKKVYVNGPGHMTKMATTPMKKSSKISSRAGSPIILKLCMQHQGLNLFNVYINDDPRLNLTYFTTMSYWVPYTFEWGNLLQSRHLMGKSCSKGLN